MTERERSLITGEELYPPITLTEIAAIASIMMGCKDHKPIRIYDDGYSSPLKAVMRAVTHEGGGFWTDRDGDPRKAYVWLSGIMEHWIPVSTLIDKIRERKVEIEGYTND